MSDSCDVLHEVSRLLMSCQEVVDFGTEPRVISAHLTQIGLPLLS